MSTGFLQIKLFTGENALPVKEATVVIAGEQGHVATVAVDESGQTYIFEVPAPPKELSLNEENAVRPYAIYDVSAQAPNFAHSFVRRLQVFEGVTTYIDIEMVPSEQEGASELGQTIVIPDHKLHLRENEPHLQEPGGVTVLKEVIVPNKVTVHLGTPTQDAVNSYVDFRDYIKNVASSEIYPTWPPAALRANIYAQISLTLNRVYTEWYPSKGYNFTITNSASYDQKYVKGRSVFENISKIVDEIFNVYVQRTGSKAPLFTSYCDGKTVTCSGLSQWGTVTLANNGRTPIQILKHYYGDNIELVSSNNLQDIAQSYPGTPLRRGSSGLEVQIMQTQLNRIARNYPAIPTTVADGSFGVTTENAVRAFQKIFSLTQDGVVGKSTWYKINYIYLSVTKLAQLTAEVENLPPARLGYPGTPLRQGSSGTAVGTVQLMLSTVGEFYTFIPQVTVDNNFGASTTNAVKEFQKVAGLTQDGVVGPTTWNELESYYKEITAGAGANNNTYPGTPLRRGSSGPNVTKIQNWLNVIGGAYPSIPRLTVDGNFGTATENAVKEFQRLFGLTVDGVVGQDTWNKMYAVYTDVQNGGTGDNVYPGTPLRRGDEGADVEKFQGWLRVIARSYSSIPLITQDGSFGNSTEQAVRAFQQQFNLSVDGVVGRNTWNRMYSVYLTLVGTQQENIFPGTVYSAGDFDTNIRRFQQWLLVISGEYSDIPQVRPSGNFDATTLSAVKAFQKKFKLPQTGKVGEGDWYKMLHESNKILGSRGNEYPGAPLKTGDSGANVSKIQTWINGVSIMHPQVPFIMVDGLFGRETAGAVRKFQRLFGLKEDGVVGEQTWKKLYAVYAGGNGGGSGYPGNPLRRGDKGADVQKFQGWLHTIALAYHSIQQIEVDGDFGGDTESAVKSFQTLFGLEVDGVVGENTWDAMYSVYTKLINGEDHTYPGEILRRGDEGADVEKVQTWLDVISNAYPSIQRIDEDGVFGAKTEDAVREYQWLFGLAVDGEVGEQTWHALYATFAAVMDGSVNNYPGTPLRNGDEGADVERAQVYLDVTADFFPDVEKPETDGRFGEGTQQAVISFQRRFGLSADGVIGESTWRRMYGVYNALAAADRNKYPGAPLQEGASGQDVAKVQVWLNTAATVYDIAAVQVDGRYGISTRDSVISFQQTFGLDADGVVGENTWTKLYQVYLNIKGLAGMYDMSIGNFSGGNIMDDYYDEDMYYEDYVSDENMQNDFDDNGQDNYYTYDENNDGYNGFSFDDEMTEEDGYSGPNNYAGGDVSDGAEFEQYDSLVPQQAVLAAAAQDMYPGTALREGAGGANVLKVQNWLRAVAMRHASVPLIPADSRFGASTKRAVMALQRLYSIAEDGIVGRVTWNTLQMAAKGVNPPANPYPGSPLNMGKNGAAVKTVQDWLNKVAAMDRRVPRVTADGRYGVDTRNSVSSFQRTKGLAPDGVVGLRTWNALAMAAGLMKQKNMDEDVAVAAKPFDFGYIDNGAAPRAPRNEKTNDTYFSDGDDMHFKTMYGAPKKQRDAYSERGADNYNFDTSDTMRDSMRGNLRDNMREPMRDSYADRNAGEYNFDERDMRDTMREPMRDSTQNGVRNDIYAPNDFDGAANNSYDDSGYNEQGFVQNENRRTAPIAPRGSYIDAPAQPLRLGSRGPDVFRLQGWLRLISMRHTSIPTIEADGIYGVKTAEAVKAFQRLFGLVQDGVVGKATWDKAFEMFVDVQREDEYTYPNRPIKEGDKGRYVDLVQHWLNGVTLRYRGLQHVKMDGVFGDTTKKAVMAYQRRRNLRADGVVGEGTWNSLTMDFQRL